MFVANCGDDSNFVVNMAESNHVVGGLGDLRELHDWELLSYVTPTFAVHSSNVEKKIVIFFLSVEFVIKPVGTNGFSWL